MLVRSYMCGQNGEKGCLAHEVRLAVRQRCSMEEHYLQPALPSPALPSG